jgi:hypothetical protein
METSQPGIKHWRTFGATEWHHVREGALGLMLGSILPVGIFYGCYRTWGFPVAVVAVLSWSTLVFVWHYRRTHGADVFSATTFTFACIKATAGLVSGDPILYLAWPSLENVIYGGAFLGSALLGRPVLLYAQRLYPIPADVRASHAFRRVFLIVSAVWLCGHAVRGVVRLVLLFNLPLEQSLLADIVASWPINISLVAFTTWYPLRQLRRAGFMSIASRPLPVIDAVELGVEGAAPTTV